MVQLFKYLGIKMIIVRDSQGVFGYQLTPESLSLLLQFNYNIFLWKPICVWICPPGVRTQASFLEVKCRTDCQWLCVAGVMLVHHRGGNWYPLWFLTRSNPAAEGSFSRLDEVGSWLFLFASIAAIPKAHSYSFGSLNYPLGIVPRICGASKLAAIGCFCHLFPVQLTSVSNTDNSCDPIVTPEIQPLAQAMFPGLLEV